MSPLIRFAATVKLLCLVNVGPVLAVVTGVYRFPTPPAYRAQNSAGLPHYYPQPYLGGYHAFGTPYRVDYFYRYYGPKFALGRWL